MRNHLISCALCPEDVKKKARIDKGEDSGTEEAVVDSSEPPKKKQKSFTVVAVKTLTFSPAKQVEFEDQVLRAWISAGFSFNSIKDPEIRKLFTLCSPGAKLPGRKKTFDINSQARGHQN